MAFYQLTLFYPNLKEHQASVRAVHEEVRIVAGKNFRVLSAGEQVCAIGFVSDEPPAKLRGRFQDIGQEHFFFLLVQVDDIITGYMTNDVWQWLSAHAPWKREWRIGLRD